MRLGEGVGANGRLSEAAMVRAIEALKICSAKLAERNVERVRMIATEACRAAENGDAFIARVRDETGLSIEIVSGEGRGAAGGGGVRLARRHARLRRHPLRHRRRFVGAGVDRPCPSPDGRKRRMADRIRTWMSLPVGVVNVSERHGGKHITPAQFDAMVDEVTAMVASFPQGAELDAAVKLGGVHMLGTSGTVTTLAGIHLGLPRYDRRKVDGVWLSGERVAGLIEELVAMDYEQRIANPCIGASAPISCSPVALSSRPSAGAGHASGCASPTAALREGVLVEMMAADGVWRARSGRRAGERFHG